MESSICGLLFFFFSSRRRHTRCSRDWSSDVCSSDLFHQLPEAIWKAVTDIDAMPMWRQGLQSVKPLPDKNGLPSWVETSASGTIPFETVVSQPPSRLIVRIADSKLPFGGTWTYEITPAAAGCSLRIREDGEIYNPVFRFLSRFVFGYSGTMDTYLRSLEKKFGEQAQAGN